MGQSKSAAVTAYRREISTFVQQVLDHTGWNKSEAARRANVAHTTIKRALEASNRTEFETLMALSQASSLEIPESLKRAAAAAKQPTTVAAPTISPKVQAYIRDVTSKPDEVQRALYDELTKRYGDKAG